MQIWTLAQDSSLQLLQVLVQTAFPVESISLNPGNKSFLMALTDGTLTLWQLDTLQELYQYKHGGPVHGLTFTAPDEFYFTSGAQVLLSSMLINPDLVIGVTKTMLSVIMYSCAWGTDTLVLVTLLVHLPHSNLVWFACFACCASQVAAGLPT